MCIRETIQSTATNTVLCGMLGMTGSYRSCQTNVNHNRANSICAFNWLSDWKLKNCTFGHTLSPTIRGFFLRNLENLLRDAPVNVKSICGPFFVFSIFCFIFKYFSAAKIVMCDWKHHRPHSKYVVTHSIRSICAVAILFAWFAGHIVRVANASDNLNNNSNSNINTPQPCDRTRRVFTEVSGEISDGPAGFNYTQVSGRFSRPVNAKTL